MLTPALIWKISIQRSSQRCSPLPSDYGHIGQPSQVATLPMSSLHVLVLSNHLDITNSLKLLLELHDHSVIAAYDAESVLHRSEAFGVGAAIIDADMPGGAGFEIFKSLRAAFGDDILLIGLTSWDTPEISERFRTSGCDYRFLKPANPEYVAGLIASRGAMQLRKIAPGLANKLSPEVRSGDSDHGLSAETTE